MVIVHIIAIVGIRFGCTNKIYRWRHLLYNNFGYYRGSNTSGNGVVQRKRIIYTRRGNKQWDRL